MVYMGLKDILEFGKQFLTKKFLKKLKKNIPNADSSSQGDYSYQ